MDKNGRPIYINPTGMQLFVRYMRGAAGYWRGKASMRVWALFLLLIAIILLQLLVQYLINFWNRDFFNALNKRDVDLLWGQARIFIILAVSSIVLAILNVWGKMTIQRRWREWLSKLLMEKWLTNNHYRHINALRHTQLNAEYRIAEDARIATDTPVDLILGLFTAILTGLTFIGVLFQVGGNLDMNLGGFDITIPGYLVLSAVAYSLILTISTIAVGRRLTDTVSQKNHAEAEFRAAASKLREHGEGRSHSGQETQEKKTVETALEQALLWWKNLCWQLMRTTIISHGNSVVAPVVGLLLCAPKYLQQGMSLGQVVQAAAAFVTVQSSLNWLMDNYPRIADWRSSANRVAFLLFALDEVEEKDRNSAPSQSDGT